MPQGALSGLRVLELNRFVAAPLCAKFLAGFGAEVIKVEPPGGEPTRLMGPFQEHVPHPETGAPYLFLNTGKKSITLDPSSKTGYALLLQLMEQTDIFVTDLPPKALEDLHLDYPALEGANPRLIMTAISFFGQTGPYRDYLATELTGFAMSGYMFITGDPTREPVKLAGNIGQYQGGLQGMVGTLGAVLHRELTGRGQLVDVSITEALAFETNSAVTWMNLGQMQTREGNRLQRRSPRGNYPATCLPCKDGWVHVHDAPAGFELYAVLMEEPRLADPAVLAEPWGHRDLIDELSLPWLSRYDKFEVVRRAQEMRHPFMEVLDIPEVLADPQHEARGYFVEVNHPVVGRVKQPGAPVHASGIPWETRRPPLLGEHNQEIYQERLGLAAGDLALLRERGVI
ncbi:MAG: CoA transferase [Chloroflexi bacterium]|nr:CoA transferase [Chloroflexota bacterium]